jgi:hypothetical protein
MDKYFADMVLSIDLSKFPEPIQSVLRVLQLKGAKAAPELFTIALDWVWESEKQYVPSYYFDEINGMAAGLCDSLRGNCNVTAWISKIEQFNMIPELVKMACTAYGAWGKSTPNSGLIQLRALDFGSGPFANYTVIQTHRPTESSNAFISVAFPCMIGVVTGVSQSGIGLSQKVWTVYDENGEAVFLPGAYDGEPAVYVIRDILQNSKNRFAFSTYVSRSNFSALEVMLKHIYSPLKEHGRFGLVLVIMKVRSWILSLINNLLLLCIPMRPLLL